MVEEGLSNAHIAGRLYLSESTIKQHLRAAYKELGVRNRTQAAKTMRRLEASKGAPKPSAQRDRTLPFLALFTGVRGREFSEVHIQDRAYPQPR